VEPFAELIGESPGVVDVREQVRTLLKRQADGRRLPPILIQGETGTGKGILARAVHRAGPRASAPFMSVNCAAIPATLLEAELFGYERGAFTDAHQGKIGLFQAAHRGTLFLDEVGLLPEGLQTKLLTVLEDRAIRRLGSIRSEAVDIWIISATSEDLESAVDARRFRPELYHRLAVLALRMPPLRERGRDILVLAEHFLARAAAEYGLPAKTLSDDAREALRSYEWPGNVRELSNVMERLTLLTEAPVVTAQTLGLPQAPRPVAQNADRPDGTAPTQVVAQPVDRERLLSALRETNWNVSRAAARLGLTRNAMRYWIAKLEISRDGEGKVAPRPDAAVTSAVLSPAEPVRIRWERRHVALLRAAVAPTFAANPSADPTRALDVLVQKAHSFGGRVEDLRPTEITAAFGVEPIEDAPRRAALAAMAMQRAAARDGRGNEGAWSLRVGVHVDQMLVGRVAGRGELDDEPRRQAARVLDELVEPAKPGEILVSESAGQFLERRFSLNSVTLPSGPGRRAFRLAGRESDGSRSALVGRRPEFAAFKDAVGQLSSGRGSILAVTGEAGLGKSRLVTELKRDSDPRALRWLEGRALSFRQTTSYGPFHDLLRAAAGIGEDDRADEAWAKLEGFVTALFPEEGAEVQPYLATLLGLELEGDLDRRLRFLDGKAVGRQIFRTSRRVFERLARDRPLVLVFEDWHWADESSAALLEHLLPLVETVPLLTCVVSRPDPGTPAARLREVAQQRYPAQYREIVLFPLPPDDSARLVEAMLGPGEVAPGLRELILRKTEGNPFFIEEVVRSLVGMGALAQDKATGVWRVTAEMEQLAIPDTIEGVILARIGRLGDEVRQVLEIASVIGRSFFDRVLRAVLGPERNIGQHLDRLRELELIREKQQIPEREFAFKHALVQEATYQSIAEDRRRQLHRRVAQCFEISFADRVEEFFSLLAYHYARAEEWEKAQDYLFKAGDQAERIAADAEALAHYKDALAIYERVFGQRWEPLQRASLERKMAEAFFRRGDHERAVEYLHRAWSYLGRRYPRSRWGLRGAILGQLAQQIAHRLLPGVFMRAPADRKSGAIAELVRICTVLCWVDYFIDQERLLFDALTWLNASERAGYPAGISVGSTVVGIISDLIPLRRIARQYHRRAVAIAEKLEHVAGWVYTGLAMHEDCQGAFDLAREHYRRSAAAYKAAGDLHGWGAASILSVWLLPPEEARARCEEIAKLGETSGDPAVWGWGMQGLGRLLWQAGDLERSAAHLEKAIELLSRVPDYPNVAVTNGDLGMCYLRQGKLGEALAILESGRRLIADRALRGIVLTRIYGSLAEAHVVAFERARGVERVGGSARAKRACRAALKQSKVDRKGAATAYRCQGTYEWLNGKAGRARKWWDRSLAVAGELGDRYEAGLTQMEIGKRTRDDAALHRAEALFSEVGARLDIGVVQRLLREAAPGSAPSHAATLAST